MSLLIEQADLRTLVDALLEEQQQLTPVARFSKRKDAGTLPAQAQYYRDLIPLSRPEKGQQYAFAVDMDRCTGCKACVSACHSLNGLDEDEAWRDTGLIVGGTESVAYQQTVTTACHHCVEPACLEGCPVKAYEKDEQTGIVRHLDDQCIGCQYCVLKCPYDVPKYSKVRGIVRKCDMCHGRLSAGEAPACVQACPSGAITIRIVEKSAITELIQEGERLLPGAYLSDYTKPTTSYNTRHLIPQNAAASDRNSLRLEPAHWPLVWMLVLTQMSVGMFWAGAALLALSPDVFRAMGGVLSGVAFIVLNAGLAASTLHLGRPLGAWRAFLGLRTSWMSREILAFSALAGTAGIFCLCALWPVLAQVLPALKMVERYVDPTVFLKPAAFGTSVLGIISVICSGMIYVDTKRVLWRAKNTFLRFGGATALVGASGSAALFGWAAIHGGSEVREIAPVFGIATLVIRTGLFLADLHWLKVGAKEGHPDEVSIRLTQQICGSVVSKRRLLFAVSTGLGLIGIMMPGVFGAMCASASFLSTFAAQILERYLYFTTVVAYRMPGFVSPKPVPAH